MFNYKKVLGLLIALAACLAAFSTAAAFYNDYRPWPTRSEYVQVGNQTYETALAYAWDALLKVQDRIEVCKITKKCSRDRMIELKKQENRLAMEISRLEQEKANLKND